MTMQILIKNNAITQTTLLLFLAAVCFGLSACGSDSKPVASAKAYVASVKQEPLPTITPIPQLKKDVSLPYQFDKTRNPFQPPLQIASQGPKPDMDRPKEPLEQYALGDLKMVGTLEQDKRYWALLLTPDGLLVRVTTGNYIGQNFGRITAITPTEIDLLETVQTGDAWRDRKTSIALQVVAPPQQ